VGARDCPDQVPRRSRRLTVNLRESCFADWRTRNGVHQSIAIADVLRNSLNFNGWGSTVKSKTGRLSRARSADAVDEEVGRRVRSRRLEQGLSQTELADQIGVTFQQVQKYERGTNRIGASRLERIAKTLKVPIPFFFVGGNNDGVAPGKDESVFRLMQTSGAVRVVKAFHRIKSSKARQLLVAAAEELALR